MSSIGSVATSGLFASEKRARAAAENIINAKTVGFEPKDVLQEAGKDDSGVTSQIVDRKAPTVKVTNPDGTTEEFADISLDGELVNLQIASYDYKANTLVLKADKENKDTLLDIQA